MGCRKMSQPGPLSRNYTRNTLKLETMILIIRAASHLDRRSVPKTRTHPGMTHTFTIKSFPALARQTSAHHVLLPYALSRHSPKVRKRRKVRYDELLSDQYILNILII